MEIGREALHGPSLALPGHGCTQAEFVCLALQLHGGSAQSRLHGAMVVLLYILTLYSRCFTLLPRCALAALSIVMLHATLRRAGSEYGFHYEFHVKLPTAAANGDAAAASPARGPVSVAEASVQSAAIAEKERLGKQNRPGFSFEKVWRGSEGGAAAAEDPRRLLREMWAGSKWASHFMAGACGRLLQYYWMDAKDRIRHWRWGL